MVDAMASTLGRLGLSEQAQRLRIAQHWSAAVGARIADRTLPHAFARGVLTVKVASSAWQNELTFLKEDIIARLNELLGQRLVRDLKVVSGHLGSSAGRRGAPPARPTAEEASTAAHTAEAIGDPEVRAAFGGMMSRYLAAKRKPELEP